MDWNPEQTVTVGAIFVGLISAFILMLRLMGARTDPKLLELFELQAKSNERQATMNNENYGRLADALDRNTDTLTTVKSGIEAAFTGFAESIKDMVITISQEHERQTLATNAILPAIEPKIESLTAQLSATEESNKGIVKVIEGMGKTQSSDIKQVLEAILRIEKGLTGIKDELASLRDDNREREKRLDERIEKTEQDIKVVKSDLINMNTPPTTPAPDNQPIVMPKVEITKKTEPKTVTEFNEKEDTNEASI